MIIDCHGHYTTEPKGHMDFRKAQIGAAETNGFTNLPYPMIADEDIRESIANNQLKALKERGADITLFSPRASGMGHHIGDYKTSQCWTQHSNDLIAEVVKMFPDSFYGVCQLPQSIGVSIENSIAELERCVLELGFVGCNLNPDPTGGYWKEAPLTDEAWHPLYEKMIELDVPAMIHVSGSCNPNHHTTGAHYLNADTSAFMQLLQGDLFQRFPELRFIIPHGGGAVPYHFGRFRGLIDKLGKPNISEHLMKNIFFDTCVYHQAGIDLLFEVIDVENILFGSEMFGAVSSIDPETGFYFDDTKRYIDAVDLSPEDREKVFEKNARRIYPRLDQQLKDKGL